MSTKAEEICKLHPNAVLLESRAITCLLTTIRDRTTPTSVYVSNCDRLMRMLAEEGLAQLQGVEEKTVQTPCGTYRGLCSARTDKLCCVSIVRSGDILLEAVRQLVPSISVGKILLQRDESDPAKRPRHFFHKLPHAIKEMQVILVDPMLATGGSALKAIKVLVDEGVSPDRVIFLNVVCCPEGLKALLEAYPAVKIVTCALDERLNDQKFIVPGLGDFGDRYYSTE
eukprot:RCo018675